MSQVSKKKKKKKQFVYGSDIINVLMQVISHSVFNCIWQTNKLSPICYVVEKSSRGWNQQEISCKKTKPQQQQNKKEGAGS